MISRSPYGEKFKYTQNLKGERLKMDSLPAGRKTVVVQGLGFVGSAMAAALSSARDADNKPTYNVIGVDLADKKNYWKIAMINSGKSPTPSMDRMIDRAYRNGRKSKNLIATYSQYAYTKADVVLVDVGLDINKAKNGNTGDYSFSFDKFRMAIMEVALYVRKSALIIIETTVPPGATENVIYPIFKEVFSRRGISPDNIGLVYSYERVMPGPNCLDSIVNFYRVYAGINKRSAERAKRFFKTFINTDKYPLFEMPAPRAAEMAKVLENSFRAMNIAYIQEWTEYAHKAGVNLFNVIGAIRKRPTHANIMLPGFGVGGYCLTKDAMLADWSYRNIFGGKSRLGMSLQAIATNDLMPSYAFSLLKKEVGALKNRLVTILGVTYLNDVADTRNSPSGIFYDKCLKEGARVLAHDPVINFWEEKKLRINTDIRSLKKKKHDIAVFTVRHKAYVNMPSDEILATLKGVKVIVDANGVLTDRKAKELLDSGIKILGVGKGHWQNPTGLK